MGNSKVDTYWIEHGRISRAFAPLRRLPLSRWRPKHFARIAEVKLKFEPALQAVLSDAVASKSVFGLTKAQLLEREHAREQEKALLAAESNFARWTPGLPT